MYNQITIEHSLFFIDDSYITNFQQLAEKMKPLLTIDELGYFNLEDMWIAAFNYWVLSHPEEKISSNLSIKCFTILPIKL